MTIETRAQIHAALGDPTRLAMIDGLLLGDRTFQELAEKSGLRGNLAAHHLGVLDAAGLIVRHPSEGDGRRRYLSVRRDRIEGLLPRPSLVTGRVLFVGTHNSARSQFAARLWERQTGRAADSAGADPAERVHPDAILAAADYAIDLSVASPKGFAEVTVPPDLVVSVCDRARESGLPFSAPALHWSVPDPALGGGLDAFRSAFTLVAERIKWLAEAVRLAPTSDSAGLEGGNRTGVHA